MKVGRRDVTSMRSSIISLPRCHPMYTDVQLPSVFTAPCVCTTLTSFWYTGVERLVFDAILLYLHWYQSRRIGRSLTNEEQKFEILKFDIRPNKKRLMRRQHVS